MTIRIETLGSIFEIDEDDMRYRRFPKHEAPREKPEWSDERAGLLQDFIWHSFIEWGISQRYGMERLIITTGVNLDGKDICVTAPMP